MEIPARRFGGRAGPYPGTGTGTGTGTGAPCGTRNNGVNPLFRNQPTPKIPRILLPIRSLIGLEPKRHPFVQRALLGLELELGAARRIGDEPGAREGRQRARSRGRPGRRAAGSRSAHRPRPAPPVPELVVPPAPPGAPPVSSLEPLVSSPLQAVKTSVAAAAQPSSLTPRPPGASPILLTLRGYQGAPQREWESRPACQPRTSLRRLGDGADTTYHLPSMRPVAPAVLAVLAAHVLGCSDETPGPGQPSTGDCPAGEWRDETDSCVPAGLPPDLPCPPGQWQDGSGTCVAAGLPPDLACSPGELELGDGSCQPAGLPPDLTCPPR